MEYSISINVKIVCHLERTYRAACYHFQEFIESNDDIRIYSRIGGTSFVELGNGERHYFIPEASYHKWCMGKRYYMDGKIFVSGFEIVEE